MFLILEPHIHASSAPALVPNFFKHLLHGISAYGIDDEFALMIAALVVQIPARRHAGKETHLSTCSESSLHVDALLVVFELGLRPEDHQ